MQEHVTVHEPIARYQYHFVKLIFSVGSVTISTLAALAAVLVISSLLLFIAGFFTGRFSGRKVKLKQITNQPPSDSLDPVPLNTLYEEVVQARSQEQEMELKQNEAYGPLRQQ